MIRSLLLITFCVTLGFALDKEMLRKNFEKYPLTGSTLQDLQSEYISKHYHMHCQGLMFSSEDDAIEFQTEEFKIFLTLSQVFDDKKKWDEHLKYIKKLYRRFPMDMSDFPYVADAFLVVMKKHVGLTDEEKAGWKEVIERADKDLNPPTPSPNRAARLARDVHSV